MHYCVLCKSSGTTGRYKNESACELQKVSDVEHSKTSSM